VKSHLILLERVLEKLKSAGLKIKKEKSSFLKESGISWICYEQGWNFNIC
jgi:hypothetical protein